MRCPYHVVKVSLQFITEPDVLVINLKDASFSGLPLIRRSNVKRVSDLVTLELQQKFLGFIAALQQGARLLWTEGTTSLGG